MPKKNVKFFLYLLAVAAVTLALSVSFQSLLASWSGPTANPPNNNAATPINTSSDYQRKSGSLDIDGNVGIGAVSPTWKLEVSTPSDAIAALGGTRGVYARGTLYGLLGEDSDSGGVGRVGYDGNGVYGIAANTAGKAGLIGCSSGCSNYGYVGHSSWGVYATDYGGPACDIAEFYRVSDNEKKNNLEPGDVVVLDLVQELAIKKTRRAYDRNVVGVVSTNPNLTMGALEAGNDGDLPIALLGRVPAKVTAENGPIRIGDLIVSSSRPGYGMRCDNYVKCRGAIIGKALQPLASGQGKIEVLIKSGF